MSNNSQKQTLASDFKRMAPVWVMVTLAAVGSLAAIRYSGVKYLRQGVYSHEDTCQVGEVHFQAAKAMWRDIAQEALRDVSAARTQSTLGVLKGDAKIAKAKERLQEAIAVCPRITGVHELLADLAWWEGDRAQSHYHLGIEHIQVNELNQGRVELLTAQELAPENTEIHLALLDAISRQGRWEEAAAQLANAPESIRSSAIGNRIQAHQALQENNTELAETFLKESLVQRPGFSPAVDDLLHIYELSQNTLEGPQWVVKNLNSAVAPEAADFHRAAMLFYEGANYQQALESIESALGIQNNSILLMIERALILHQLGRAQEAKASMERALDLNPNVFMEVMQSSRFESLSTLELS